MFHLRLFFIFATFLNIVVAQTYSDTKARQLLKDAGISVNKVYPTTSLQGVRTTTIEGIITLKKASKCVIIITGGTEPGHAGGTYSHSNGYKLDIGLNTCINSYIKNSFKYIGLRGDGAKQYKSNAGNIYALESNHWDITYY